MATVKQYLDYAGLQNYDGKIKAWANGVLQLGYKTILKSADGNKLYFFTKPNATLSDVVASGEGATPYVELGSQDMATQLAALANVLGATWDSTNSVYTISLDNTFPSSGLDAVNTAVKALNYLKGQINTLNADDATAGSVAKSIKDAVEALDVSEFALTSVNSSILTISGIKEIDGKIAKGDTSVTLAKVAMTGAAADVSVDATTAGVSSTNVQAVVKELKDAIDDLDADSVVSLDDSGTPTTGYLKTYTLYQGTQGVGAGKTEIGKIDIPKDYLVKSGKVVTIADDEDSDGDATSDLADGTYIKLVVNTADTAAGSGNTSKLYINVATLVDIYHGSSTLNSEIQVTVGEGSGASADAYAISATVVKVAGTKVVYKAAYTDTTDPSNPVDVPEETVVDALNNIGSIPSASINGLFS